MSEHHRPVRVDSQPVRPASAPQLRRLCTCGGICATCRRRAQRASDTDALSKRPFADHDDAGFEAPRIASAGRALDPATRRFFEPRFGHDFSRVRVHVDDAATDSVLALAFTVGDRIVFAANRYRPDTGAGRRLLAHELTHVIQQSNAGSSGAVHALETEAARAGDRVAAGHDVSVAGAARRGSVQRQPNDSEDEPGSTVRVIAKENGKVAVVLVRDGKIRKGYAEIQPPPGMSAAEAATKIETRVTGSTHLKVDVIVPPGWGRQATNRATAVRVMDTDALEKERREEERQAKRAELRDLYRRYLDDAQFQSKEIGDAGRGGAFPSAADTMSDDEIRKDKLFFKWLQRDQRKQDLQDFQIRAREMGYDDPALIKEMWQEYRGRGLEDEQTAEEHTHELMSDPEQALQQNFATETLLTWMASDPQPVEIPDGDGKGKMYVLPLRGGMVTLDAAQFARLRQIAKDKIETRLNTIQHEKNTYQAVKGDRDDTAIVLDVVYGAELKGKTWGAIDEAIQAGRDAFAKGDLKTALARLAEAEKLNAAARREYDRFLHHREVGAEVTITGLEHLKTGAEIALAVGTIPLGGEGIAILTAKGVTETVMLADAKQQGGERVDWGDVALDVGLQVSSALVMHGLGKLQALGPKNAIMNAIRESFGGQVAADVMQSVVIDSATYAAKQAYQAARGRGEKFTAQDFMNHFKQYVTDPTGLPLEVLKAQLARHAVGALGGEHGEAAAPHETPSDHPPSAGAKSAEGGAVTAKSEATATADVSGPGREGGATARRPGKNLPEAQGSELRELAKNPENVVPVTDPELKRQGYEVEVSSAERTYRRKKDGTWCRWASPKECGFTLDLSTDAAVAKAAGEHEAAPSSRLAPALEPPKASDPSWYSVPGLDASNRPRPVEAVLKKSEMDVGKRPSNPAHLEAGTEKGIGYEITHLGAHELGFPTAEGNLTTASGQTNRFLGPKDTRPPTMRRVEMDVMKAVNDGQTVHYRVTPIYDGSAPYPSAFHMQAEGSLPDGSPGISIDTVVRNWTHHP
jgi:uncharacterized protein DUF4157/DNA/RNA non-specific endonuclease